MVEALPTPDEAEAIALPNARHAISQFREYVRKTITRRKFTRQESIYIEVPSGTSTIAYCAVAEELEDRGWAVRRESSPRNESFMVLRK